VVPGHAAAWTTLCAGHGESGRNCGAEATATGESNLKWRTCIAGNLAEEEWKISVSSLAKENEKKISYVTISMWQSIFCLSTG
jgi:hypothetical protein